MLKKLITLLLSISIIFISACQKKEPASTNPPAIVATIAPYAYFIDRISKGEAQAAILIPPKANLHTFEATPKEVERLSHLSLWVQIGTPVEERIEKSLLHLNPQMRILNMSQKVPLLPLGLDTEHLEHCSHHEHEGGDIHLWMGPKEAQTQARLIAEKMISLNPSLKNTYLEGLNELLNDLQTLDRELTVALKPFQDTSLLLSHPSLGYFCHDYSLKQISIECNGKEPGPLDLDSILKKSRTEKIICVITQTGFDNRGAELMAKRLNLPIFDIDPYAYDYIQEIKEIGRQIKLAGDSQSREKNSH